MSAIRPLSLSERRQVSQEQIWRYAEVSGANDPIHVDPDSAKNSRFGSTVAQGLLVFAWLSELMMRIDAESWSGGGQLEVSFRAPVRPGDTLDLHCSLQGVVEREGGSYGEYELRCDNQAGTRVIGGRAWIPTATG